MYCEPLCIPSILFTILWRSPGGVPGDCSHGIPTLYERVSYSDWFRPPPAGACIRPVVIWIWIIDDALLSPSLLSVCACFLSPSVFLFVHSQTVGVRGRQAALKRSRRVISAPGDGSALSEDVQT